MTTVYAYRDVKRGKYASRENLSQARDRALEVFNKLLSKGWIHGASVLGSVALGEHSVGSDLDLVVISKDKHFAKVRKEIRKFHEYCAPLNVDPEVIHLKTSEARTGRHSITLGMLGHIAASAKRSNAVVGRNPVNFLEVAERDWPDNDLITAIFKQNKLRKVDFASKPARKAAHFKYYDGLASYLDDPINTARRVLEHQGLAGAAALGKAKVVENFSRVNASQFPKAVTFLRQTLRARRGYQAALERVIASRAKNKKVAKAKDAYKSSLKNIEKLGRSSDVFFDACVKILESLRQEEN